MTRTVAEKMRAAPRLRTYFQSVPPHVVEGMALPDPDVSDSLTGEFDLIIAFFINQSSMRARFPQLGRHLRKGGRLWIGWPKARQEKSDLTLPKVIEIGYDFGMVESTAISIDTKWSALKFTHPKPGKVYNNSFGTLPADR